MARKRTSPVHGWLILDKPEGMTSTSAVGRLKRLYKSRKAGHAGTLDPLASGCLPIAFGEATKTVPYLVDATKTYEFTVVWGRETNTFDREGQVTASGGRIPTDAEIDAILSGFIGEIDQMPPAFSAIKVDGERAYDLARAGEKVELKARPVFIEHLERKGPTIANETAFVCVCGKGTYIRALARDFAHELNTHAHIGTLRRTQVGPFGPDDMISLALLEEMGHKGAREEGSQASPLAQCIKGLETALDDIPAQAVSSDDAARMRNGQPILLRGRDAPIITGSCLVLCGGVPVALARGEAGQLFPERVFNFSGA